MRSDDVAIGVYNVSKMYKLYDNPKDRFKEYWDSQERSATRKSMHSIM